MNELPGWIFQFMQALGGGVVVYAGIRADLARLHEKANQAVRAAEKAHARIDDMLKKR